MSLTSRGHYALLFLSVSLWGAHGASGVQSAGPDPRFPVRRQVRYSISVRNETSRPVRSADLWAFAPVRQTATQRCLSIKTSHPCDVTVDELGNQLIHFTFENVAPRSTKIVTIRADLAVSETLNPPKTTGLERFLVPEPRIESDHPEILRVAQTLKGSTPAKTARILFDWVAANVRYAGYLRENRGALYALQSKRGDCTEFMSLFVALCRANGIPARGLAGYVVGESAILNPSDYHNWAEVWDEGAWKIADPQRKVLFEKQSSYVALTILSAGSEGPVPRGNRFRVRGEGLTARMGES